ncbi:MAG: tripartite tricarboxylate transporter TctB family protein [Clostridia bacterium]|nr:tripartite tricarboxylate transporter TctB family protein [Clostridia bacterium]
MKKFNRTYLLGGLGLAISAWIVWQAGQIPTRLVANEPGPRFIPYVSAAGLALFSLLTIIFDAPKEAAKGVKPYLDKAGWIRLAIIMAEAVLFALAMTFIGFWFTAMLGMFLFIVTLKGKKKVNWLFAILLCVGLGSLCYFGFTRGFHIPLPTGTLWESLGITMP